jgi:hypothetical protein
VPQAPDTQQTDDSKAVEFIAFYGSERQRATVDGPDVFVRLRT